MLGFLVPATLTPYRVSQKFWKAAKNKRNTFSISFFGWRSPLKKVIYNPTQSHRFDKWTDTSLLDYKEFETPLQCFVFLSPFSSSLRTRSCLFTLAVCWSPKIEGLHKAKTPIILMMISFTKTTRNLLNQPIVVINNQEWCRRKSKVENEGVVNLLLFRQHRLSEELRPLKISSSI